mmetsp:Transcript_9504/g.1417  ORF Transcript_9504/g.1417 Transcript_9504/m.1417 type:complete len:123 (+) Transcript_9504:385-753(+)
MCTEIYDDPWKNYLIEILNKADYLQCLPEVVFKELVYFMNVIQLDKESYLFRPGENANYLYIVAHGELELSITINERSLHHFKIYQGWNNIEPSPKIAKIRKNLKKNYQKYNLNLYEMLRLK